MIAETVPWQDGAIAGAVVAVSLFWIRRSDASARQQFDLMKHQLLEQQAMIAELVAGYEGRPLPAGYLQLLKPKEK